MAEISRRGVLGVGTATAAGALLLSRALPAAASGTTPAEGRVHDGGGQLFDVTNTSFGSGGAQGDGTTDDTQAIIDAIAAAEAVGGTVYVPAGTYRITGPITLSGPGGLTGSGGNPGTTGAATVLLCGTSTAGLRFAGPGTYQGFCVDGSNTATVPLQEGVLSGGSATTANSHSTFLDVWVVNSAGSGWTVYGSQSSSYHHCGSRDNVSDGLYIDGGAGELDFWSWTTTGNGRYGIHADNDVSGGSGTHADHSENVRFFTGAAGAASDDGISAVYLRGAVGWKFNDMTIRGDALSGPTIDLDQSAGYALDFSRCRISSAVTGVSPGKACIQVNGSPPSGLPTGINRRTFLITDGARFLAGDNSVYLLASGEYRYTALDWLYDETAHGPVGPSGADIDPLLAGRAKPGTWRTSGTVSYRIDEIGHVQLAGSLAGGTSAMLPAGYRPTPVDSNPMSFLATLGTGSAIVTVAADGTVATTASSGTLQLSGIRFPVD